jgi:acyl carrier protein
MDIVELIMQIEKDLDVNISDNSIEFNGFLEKIISKVILQRRDKKLKDLGI